MSNIVSTRTVSCKVSVDGASRNRDRAVEPANVRVDSSAVFAQVLHCKAKKMVSTNAKKQQDVIHPQSTRPAELRVKLQRASDIVLLELRTSANATTPPP